MNLSFVTTLNSCVMTKHNYVPFYLFFIICLFLKIESFTPKGRMVHSSVLVENKLFFFGGVRDVGGSNEVFYLDVSQPFNMQVPSWNDLTPSAGLPFRSSWATASLSNINNEQTIYLFGGATQDIATNDDYFVSIIYSFNLNSLKWDVPAVKGTQPERRRAMRSVTDNSGKMYIFGGATDDLTGSPTVAKFLDDMVIFNTVELSWSISKSPITNPITKRVLYTATLLSNDVIVYIGGYDGNVNNIDISQIVLYDTKTSTWSNKVCKRLIITKKTINLNFNVYTL
jgi:N-acetylneuraminic acid mutarotase